MADRNIEVEVMMTLLEIARTVVVPEWASHVAVRNDGSKREPCLWMDNMQDYIDEPITEGEQWAAGYKTIYWTFFPLDELK
jgi:hypothetical protein